MKVFSENGVKRDRALYIRDITTETEQVGYVDAGTQIMRMIAAGENLMDYKRYAYEYQDGEVDIAKAVPDPTMKVGFDPADADFFMRRARASLEVAKVRQKQDKDNVPSEPKVSEES